MNTLLARARTVLGNQRGDYVAQQMIGAMLSLLVMGAVAAGMMSMTHIFGVITERSALTQQATSTSSALRSDTTWASAVIPGDADGRHTDTQVSFVIPGRDAHCQESTWQLRDATDGSARRELVNVVANYDAYDTSTTPVTCTGARLLLTEQVMIKDLDTEVGFRYYNPGGRMFADVANGDFASVCDGSHDERYCQTDMVEGGKPRDLTSLAVASVELMATVGKSSSMAMPYSFRETATNLHKTTTRPAGENQQQVDSFFQDHAVLAG